MGEAWVEDHGGTGAYRHSSRFASQDRRWESAAKVSTGATTATILERPMQPGPLQDERGKVEVGSTLGVTTS